MSDFQDVVGDDDDVQVVLRWLTCSACGQSGLMVLNEDGTERYLCGGCERELSSWP